MTDLPSLVPTLLLGFQSGLVASWLYYRRQRDERWSIQQQHDRERELLEHEIKHERRERRRAEDQLHAIFRNHPGNN